ncbi:hypothetical protein HY546_02045, partial [archaeon]|nr:hypothetical protein [archaeon]
MRMKNHHGKRNALMIGGFTLPGVAFLIWLVTATGGFLGVKKLTPPISKKNPDVPLLAPITQKLPPSKTEKTATPPTDTITPRNATTTRNTASKKNSVVPASPAPKQKNADISSPATKEKKQPVSQNTTAVPAPTIPPPAQAFPAPKPAPTVPLQQLQSEKDLNETIRKTIVNVYCTTKTSGAFNPASGSGVLIDPRGIILTNAHVAQYYLLKDYRRKDFITCFIRTGSPARITYRAEPLYISQRWIAANPDIN